MGLLVTPRQMIWEMFKSSSADCGGDGADCGDAGADCGGMEDTCVLHPT